MATKIKFAKIRPDAIVPSKRKEDAGWDVFANFEENWIEIPPFQSRKIPTGIASALEHGWCFKFEERSSTGIKNMMVNAGVIDEGYRGEWLVCIYNANDVPLFISKIGPTGEQSPLAETPNGILHPYSKAIAQALLKEVPEADEEVVDYEELLKQGSERGTAGFGSTDKN